MSCPTYVSTLRDKIDALEADNAALREDKARLEWVMRTIGWREGRVRTREDIDKARKAV